MAETLSNYCSKIFLQEDVQEDAATGEEQTKIVLPEELFEEPDGDSPKFLLIGKIFTKRVIDVEGLQNVMFQAWKVELGLQIRMVGDKIYLFKFGDKQERDWVMRADARAREDSSSWVTGRNGGLRNHVDSMVVRERAVARALMVAEEAQEVGAVGKARMGEQNSEEVVVVSKLNPRAGELGNGGLNESPVDLLKKAAYLPSGANADNLVGSALAHGEGIGDNQLANQTHGSEDSSFKIDGPIYGNIPGLRPVDGNLGDPN
ncbi:hypothetical protein CCACVL1_08111 [Corchorus capsularis]|uniref:DUF4283 domain-containing protein n=1 Tax=Corchorus capsularis TaxID=210143 RepID=A0A1R3J253_COCAP|nr:hypothetical protein CCACVL1_08111 [Corchorus capsularis]